MIIDPIIDRIGDLLKRAFDGSRSVLF